MFLIIAVLVMLVGVLMYALSSNPKLAEIGRLMLFAGLLAFLLLYGSQAAVSLGAGRPLIGH